MRDKIFNGLHNETNFTGNRSGVPVLGNALRFTFVRVCEQKYFKSASNCIHHNERLKFETILIQNSFLKFENFNMFPISFQFITQTLGYIFKFKMFHQEISVETIKLILPKQYFYKTISNT